MTSPQFTPAMRTYRIHIHIRIDLINPILVTRANTTRAAHSFSLCNVFCRSLPISSPLLSFYPYLSVALIYYVCMGIQKSGAPTDIEMIRMSAFAHQLALAGTSGRVEQRHNGDPRRIFVTRSFIAPLVPRIMSRAAHD